MKKKHEYAGTIVAYLNKNTYESPIIKKLYDDGYKMIICDESLNFIDIVREITNIFYNNNPELFLIEDDETLKGFNLFLLLRERNLIDNVPVIFIGKQNKNMQMKALQMGALDYIVNFTKEELYIKIINYVDLGKKLLTTTARDRITGVYTKKYGETIIRKSIAIANEEKETFSILAIKMDFVRKDKYRKELIHKILKECAIAFNEAIGSKNFIYVYGEDQFVLTFRDKNFHEVLNISLGLIEKANKIGKDNNITINTNGGISGLSPNVKEYETLIEHALEGIEKAKVSGGSQIYIFDEFYEEKKEKKILIVDKDPIIRNIMFNRYKNKGYEVFETFENEEALEISKKNKIDIVIIAIEVLGLAEKQILKKLKEAVSGVKIILMTSMQNDEIMEKAFKMGADEYIKKPLSLKELDIDIQKQVGWW